jgi:hypothetical protein
VEVNGSFDSRARVSFAGKFVVEGLAENIVSYPGSTPTAEHLRGQNRKSLPT